MKRNRPVTISGGDFSAFSTLATIWPWGRENRESKTNKFATKPL